MKRTRALILATAVVLAAGGCSGSGSATSSSSNETGRATTGGSSDTADAARGLLRQVTPPGYRADPVASGVDPASDAGQQISETTLTGPHFFQIACSGNGQVFVTVAAQSHQITCGDRATGFPFRGKLAALVVGQASNSGAYAWRVIPKA